MADPLVDFFWERLTPRAQAVVAAHAESILAALRKEGPYASRDCGLACAYWAKAFDDAGVPTLVMSGNYNPDHDPLVEDPMSTEHVWLEVDGYIVDPTAGQFTFQTPFGVEHYHAAGSFSAAEYRAQAKMT